MLLARHRLALGVRPRDAGSGLVAGPLDVAVDRPIDPGYRATNWPPKSGRTGEDGFLRLDRQPSGAHVLLQSNRFTSPVTLRIVSPDRRYTPRKLRVDVAPGSTVRLEPTLFMGAAHPMSPRATAIRGRVVDPGGVALRWARVEARRVAAAPGTGLIVGHAHGDDRGDFLLVLEPDLVGIGALPASADVELTAFVANASLVPSPPWIRDLDPYWDVPVEVVPGGATATNPVLSGIQRPAGYTLSKRELVNVELGFLRSEVEIVIP